MRPSATLTVALIWIRLDETAFEQLMRLYLLNGNRSAALNAYRQFAADA